MDGGAVRPGWGGQGRVSAVRVSGTNNTHGSPQPLQVRGFPISWGSWKLGIYRAVSHRWAILGAMGRVVPFLPPAASSGPEPVSPDHPICHVPSVAGAVEAVFAGRDLAPATCRTYRQALDPRPSTSRGYALELFGALSLQTLRVGITTAVVVPSTKTRTPLLPAATAPPA